mgnify:CR=1 FL=1
MPLTKRQKRRLLETSKMIESTILVKNDMVEIQYEYAQEIDFVINEIQAKRSKPKPQETSTGLDLIVSNEENTQTEQNHDTPNDSTTQDSPQEDIEKSIPMTTTPDWAKKLWKNIAKKCHPDRIHVLELTPLEASKRSRWFLESKRIVEQEDWPKLIHIGVQVDEWVDELNHKTQNTMLSQEYNKNSKKIEEIQSSLAWQWGTNWDKHDVRIKILIALCRAQGITPPTNEEIIAVLVNLEID